MKIELSKREVEVIIELMELGITYEITHGNPQFRGCKISDNMEVPNEQKEGVKIINTNELMRRLKGKIK